MKLEYKDYTLDFTFDAGTSRGILRQHEIVLLRISEPGKPAVYGHGESAPLPGLSPETVADIMELLPDLKQKLLDLKMPENREAVFDIVSELVPQEFPSVKIGLETALLDLMSDGRKVIFEGPFAVGNYAIPINGLIWMGDLDWMQQQADSRISSGFGCIKMKIGAIDFEKELSLLKYIRDKAPEVILRVDANGAFEINRALAKLSQLEHLELHSIEQPIMPKQPEAMQLLCKKSKIPIALDEELIGVHGLQSKSTLLDFIQPDYLVLKPTLLGGFRETSEWIALAEERDIGWWITSALESNITLNAIAQYTAHHQPVGHQGLGTGSLYKNNFECPLQILGDQLSCDPTKGWKLDVF